MKFITIQPKLKVPPGPFCEFIESSSTDEGEVLKRQMCRFCGDECILFKQPLVKDEDCYGMQVHKKDANCSARIEESLKTEKEEKGSGEKE